MDQRTAFCLPSRSRIHNREFFPWSAVFLPELQVEYDHDRRHLRAICCHLGGALLATSDSSSYSSQSSVAVQLQGTTAAHHAARAPSPKNAGKRYWRLRGDGWGDLTAGLRFGPLELPGDHHAAPRLTTPLTTPLTCTSYIKV
jgi:hypothetical protein